MRGPLCQQKHANVCEILVTKRSILGIISNLNHHLHKLSSLPYQVALYQGRSLGRTYQKGKIQLYLDYMPDNMELGSICFTKKSNGIAIILSSWIFPISSLIRHSHLASNSRKAHCGAQMLVTDFIQIALLGLASVKLQLKSGLIHKFT